MLLPHLAHRCVTRIRWRTASRTPASSRRTSPAARRRGSTPRGSDDRVPRSQQVRGHAGLPDRRRPRDAHLAGQPGRARSCTSTSGRSTRQTGRAARPARHRPRPGRAGPAPRVLPGRCWSATSWPSRDLPRAAPVTSGSKGLHLYAALPKRFAARDESDWRWPSRWPRLPGEHPGLVTATMTKARRSGKVFLDWSQNAGSKTTISPCTHCVAVRSDRGDPGLVDRGGGGAEDVDRRTRCGSRRSWTASELG